MAFKVWQPNEKLTADDLNGNFSELDFAPNTRLSNKYHTFQIPFVSNGSSYLGFVNNSIAASNGVVPSGVFSNLNTNGYGSLIVSLLGYGPVVANKQIRLKWRCAMPIITGSFVMGLAQNMQTGILLETEVRNSVRFVNNANVLYAVNGNGTTVTNTNISNGIVLPNLNTYEIVFTGGVNCLFYVNGVLKASHTTNLPTGDMIFGFGINLAANTYFSVTPINVSIEL